MSTYYYNFLSSRIDASKVYDFREKKQVVFDKIQYMLIKTLSMFKYKNLPETISRRTMELYFQLNGYAGFYKYENNLYCLQGSLGGDPDPNYMPTTFTFSNPALRISKELKINKECIIIPNDDMYFGLYPLMCKYATAETENELSLFIADILSRIPAMISAGDDTALESAKKFLQDIEVGKLGAIADSEFLEGIKAQPVNSSNNRNITQLIEYEQYLRAGFYNEIGLNANYNMKRESLNSNESQLNDDMLYPMIDNMLKNRKEGLERVNKMFGTDISVELDSSWKDNYEEKELTLENMENNEEPEEPVQEEGEKNVETPET